MAALARVRFKDEVPDAAYRHPASTYHHASKADHDGVKQGHADLTAITSQE